MGWAQNYHIARNYFHLAIWDKITDSGLCVLRPCSQRMTVPQRCESQMLGSRTAASVAIVMPRRGSLDRSQKGLGSRLMPRTVSIG